MARPLRIEYEGALYHVSARGNERGKIFFIKTDYLKFKEYLADVQRKYGLIIHCYVLMTNHYHLLIETPGKDLSKVMHYLNSSYTTYTNIKRKRSGHLFQGRYKAIVVEKEGYLLELSRYIHLNPVRANMVQRPEEYPYSSYVAYTTGTDDLVTPTAILSLLAKSLAKSRKQYQLFVESSLSEQAGSPLKNVYGGMILGSKEFIKDTLKYIDAAQLNNQEISYRNALKSSACGFDDILGLVCERYGVELWDVLNVARNDLRKICIYLAKKHVALTNRQIRERLGGMSGLAVAKAYQRMVMSLKTDISLREEISWFDNQMSHVKG
jgi:putative transposase